MVRAMQAGDANTAAALSVDQAFVVKPGAGKFALNLTANPADGGAIAASPANPDGYLVGSAVQITATANSGYVFSGFTGDLQSAQASQQVTVKGNLNVTANFLPISQNAADVLLFGVNSGPQTLDTGSPSAPAIVITPVSGGAWLLAAPDSKTPGAIQVSVDPAVASKLAQGSYTSYLVLTSPAAARVITVKLSAGIAQVERVADAAGYTPGNVASNALFSLIGVNLPTDGANFWLVDEAGVSRPLQAIFAIPSQINFLTPPGLTLGQGAVNLATSTGQSLTVPVHIAPVAPGLFSADASGQGVAVGSVLRVPRQGSPFNVPLASCTKATGCLAIPVDMGSLGDQVFLTLYGTGIRGRSSLSGVSATVGGSPADVLYAGPQSQFPGIDQVNLRLPSSLAGKGDVTVQLNVDGVAGNAVHLLIQ